MARSASCQLCGINVRYNPEEIYHLGKHMIVNHPESQTMYFDTEDIHSVFPKSSHICFAAAAGRGGAKGGGKGRGGGKGGGAAGGKAGGAAGGKAAPKQDKKRLYKTTVETWRPGTNPLLCPGCGCCGHPLIRRQKNKIATNSIGAVLLMGCWPICFVPLLMCGKGQIIAVCKNCGFVYGVYDRAKGKLRPLTENRVVQLPKNF